jgi:hypothetical protein
MVSILMTDLQHLLVSYSTLLISMHLNLWFYVLTLISATCNGKQHREVPFWAQAYHSFQDAITGPSTSPGPPTPLLLPETSKITIVPQ